MSGFVNKKGNMKNNYEIQRIAPSNYEAVASTYAEVFAGEPWKEVSKCKKCGGFSAQSPSQAQACECGGNFSLPAYPLDETTAYVGQELSRPDAAGVFLSQVDLLQNLGSKAFGFGWGFQSSARELVSKKYRTVEMQRIVSELLVSAGFFYYVSEVGVLPSLQGSGYGKSITNTLVTSAEKSGYRDFVVRTNEDSAMRYILEKIGMKPVIGLQTGIKDSENESRVLFVGKK